MLPKREQIEERILQSFDRTWYDAIYSQMCYAYGEKWGASPSYVDGSAANEDLPIYPDVRVGHLPIGQSRRILNATWRTLSRVLSKAPLPKFPQANEVQEEVWQRVWLAGANGNRGIPAKWLKHQQYAFVEGDSLGVGAIKHGLRSHPRTGMQVTDMKHVPLLQTYWDSYESDPRNSSWVAVAEYLPYDVAEARFGKAKVHEYKRRWTVNSEGRESEFVRIIEYWDIGIGDKEPAYCMFIGDLTNGKVESNELGFIPVDFCVNFVAPGMKRPMGRVLMQMSTQELINDIERYMRMTMKAGPPLDVLDPGAFDPASLARYKAGDRSQALELNEGFTEDVSKMFARQSGMEVPQGVLALFSIANQQYNDDSNQTEQTRGNALGSRATAREVMNLQARAAESASLTDQQATEFLQDVVRGSLYMSSIGDTHPLQLNIFGNTLPFNQPGTPDSYLSTWLKGVEEHEVIIGIESSTAADDIIKRQQKQQELAMLQPLVGMTVNPMQYTVALLEAMDEKDIEKWVLEQPISAPTQESENTNG